MPQWHLCTGCMLYMKAKLKIMPIYNGFFEPSLSLKVDTLILSINVMKFKDLE